MLVLTSRQNITPLNQEIVMGDTRGDNGSKDVLILKGFTYFQAFQRPLLVVGHRKRAALITFLFVDACWSLVK